MAILNIKNLPEGLYGSFRLERSGSIDRSRRRLSISSATFLEARSSCQPSSSKAWVKSTGEEWIRRNILSESEAHGIDGRSWSRPCRRGHGRLHLLYRRTPKFVPSSIRFSEKSMAVAGSWLRQRLPCWKSWLFLTVPEIICWPRAMKFFSPRVAGCMWLRFRAIIYALRTAKNCNRSQDTGLSPVGGSLGGWLHQFSHQRS